MITRSLLSLMIAAMLALVMPLVVHATPVDDAAALDGVEKAKGVFQIDFTEAEKTAFYLEIIRGTHANFVRQGLDPDLVIVFIGPTVKFLTTEAGEEVADPATLMRIESEVARLADLGVRLQVCAVATDVFGVDNDTLFDGLELTGDGFVAMIGWQAQGYHPITMF
ncbi:DsrE family protein [Guyparkeria hydrothermalis]|uniref:DsrE family protein n=1 Tax=Guyparkeria hydrothermalis TaxID=923 RepID=UPI002020F1B0|nr:DsrE family protein [Guyparkeria hydrothermalis]MCL7745284.1 DsrE family protein [Guyparkeria hydrothermalis]